MLTNSNNAIRIKDTRCVNKNCNRLFEYYPKKSNWGLGLGLNIVKNLCDALKICTL